MSNEMNSPTVFRSLAGESEVIGFYNSMLASWPVKHETQVVLTRHGSTFVIVSGERGADPLVLLHGAGTNSTMWIGDIADYSKHYRVYAIDLIGEAGKSDPNRPPWDSPAYEEWLTDVFDALNIEQATIVGISQGAWTAIKFAVAKPEQVNKLVLIAPGGIIPDKMMFVVKVLPLMMLGPWGIRHIVKMLYADHPIPEGVTEAMTIMMRHFKPRVGVLPLFTDQELSQLTMPTLFIGGAKDALRDSEKIAERLLEFVPILSVKLIPGGGHALNDTTNTIVPFLLDRETQSVLLESDSN